MIEPAVPAGEPRAFLKIAGLSVARQQLSVALALGCERVVCIARTLPPPLIDVQHAAEQAGVRFNTVASARARAGLITAADDVIVLADGLFASTAAAVTLLEKGPAILVQPVNEGLAAGFERIDLNLANGGALRIPGRLIEQLGDLPADCDVASALQRIALQAGIAQRPIGDMAGSGGLWTMVRNDTEAHALEPLWIRRRIAGFAADPGPSRAVAIAGIRRFGAALLHGGAGPAVFGASAVVLGAFGLGAAWFGAFISALGLFAAANLAGQCYIVIGGVQSGTERRDWRALLGLIALDLVLVAVLGLATPGFAGAPIWLRAYPALVLVGLIRLLGAALHGRWLAWLEDRAVLALLLGFAILAGNLDTSIRIATLGLIAGGLLAIGRRSRLTPP